MSIVNNGAVKVYPGNTAYIGYQKLTPSASASASASAVKAAVAIGSGNAGPALQTAFNTLTENDGTFQLLQQASLKVVGSLNNAGVLNIGVGSMNIAGNFTQSAAGALDITLTPGGGAHTFLTVGNGATLNGLLNVDASAAGVGATSSYTLLSSVNGLSRSSCRKNHKTRME